jgi:hypothetical protein
MSPGDSELGELISISFTQEYIQYNYVTISVLEGKIVEIWRDMPGISIPFASESCSSKAFCSHFGADMIFNFAFVRKKSRIPDGYYA